eukprot:TRINITY_DN6456_c0_g1_i1.p1 TRINITY_DN6456_c0_g1~~TRINITY_DN6456_c0_g1_i1.p1  ORF type:complete len:659 (-),score=-2.39 TRINITY_DN6456_c0_g1_i1:468-2444(-)
MPRHPLYPNCAIAHCTVPYSMTMIEPNSSVPTSPPSVPSNAIAVEDDREAQAASHFKKRQLEPRDSVDEPSSSPRSVRPKLDTASAEGSDALTLPAGVRAAGSVGEAEGADGKKAAEGFSAADRSTLTANFFPPSDSTKSDATGKPQPSAHPAGISDTPSELHLAHKGARPIQDSPGFESQKKIGAPAHRISNTTPADSFKAADGPSASSYRSTLTAHSLRAVCPRATPTDSDDYKKPLPPAIHTPTPTTLGDLSPELLLRILEKAALPAGDLIRYATLSSAWRDACFDRRFWTKLRFGAGRLRPGTGRLAARCQGSLAELVIDDPTQCSLNELQPILVACATTLRRVTIHCDAILALAAAAAGRGRAGAAAGALKAGVESLLNLLWLIGLTCRDVTTLDLHTSYGQEEISGSTAAAATTRYDLSDTILASPAFLCFVTMAFRSMQQFSCLLPIALTPYLLSIVAIAWSNTLVTLRFACMGVMDRAAVAAAAAAAAGDAPLDYRHLLVLHRCARLRRLELVGGWLTGSGARRAGSGGVRGGGDGSGGAAADADASERLSAVEAVVLTGVQCTPEVVAGFAVRMPKLQRIRLQKRLGGGGGVGGGGGLNAAGVGGSSNSSSRSSGQGGVKRALEDVEVRRIQDHLLHAGKGGVVVEGVP